ncbi:MAG: heparinase II/III domain-containing protein [Gemmatimonadaceae bacterium]
MLPRLWWYVHRVRAMPAAEVAFRSRQLGRRALEWASWATDRSPNLESLLIDSTLDVTAHFLDATERAFLPFLEQWRRAREQGEPVPTTAAATVAEGERLLRGDWTLFGRPISLQDPPAWHLDPLGKRQWSRTFYAFIDHRSGRAKYVWELARHQWVATLARAYVWTGDERYAIRACGLLQAWIRDNPPGEGIHWTSPFECALRLISWSFIFHATRRSQAWDEASVAAFLRSLTAQARFVEAHPSRFSSANNHRVAEAAGLACVGICFPEFRDADRWQRNGLNDLKSELMRQIAVDGTGAEQAPYYLACVLDHGLFIEALLRARGWELSADCRARLVAAGRFLERLDAGATFMPAIGDADDGRAIPLDDEGVSVFHAARIGAAALFGATTLKRRGDPVLERVYWLCGWDASRVFASIHVGAPTPSSVSFPDGGTTIVVEAGGQSRAVFDHGALGYLSIAAHGHADALSVILDVAGEPLIADAGTFSYHEATEWRRYFRGTRAHSTVCVAGKDQSESLGDTLWGRKATVTTELVALGRRVQCVLARHDGYARSPRGVLHRRGLLSVGADYWLVIDWLEGLRTPPAEILWHLHGTASVGAPWGGGRWLLRTRGGVARDMLMAATVPLSVRVVCGEESPPLGWASDRYGEKHPISVVVASVPAGGPWVAATAIGAALGSVAVEAVEGGTLVKVKRQGVVDTILWRNPGARTVAGAGMILEGHSALVRIAQSGKVIGIAAFGSTQLSLANDLLWSARAPADVMTGEFAGSG